MVCLGALSAENPQISTANQIVCLFAHRNVARSFHRTYVLNNFYQEFISLLVL